MSRPDLGLPRGDRGAGPWVAAPAHPRLAGGEGLARDVGGLAAGQGHAARAARRAEGAAREAAAGGLRVPPAGARRDREGGEEKNTKKKIINHCE